MNKILTFTTIVTVFAFSCAFAEEGSVNQKRSNLHGYDWYSNIGKTGTAAKKRKNRVESVADRLYSHSNGAPDQSVTSNEAEAQFCDTNSTGIITVYTTNGMAKKEIDVKIDGRPVGSLSTYFPDGEPVCKTPNAAGVITININEGKHTLEADSSNISWPSHSFSVKKCGCTVLPLS